MLHIDGWLSGVWNSEHGVDIAVTSGDFVSFEALTVLRADILEFLGEVTVMTCSQGEGEERSEHEDACAKVDMHSI